MFLFGFTTIMQGLVKNYAGLVTTRFFLGLFETGMFPGGTFMISPSQYLSQRSKKLTSTASFLPNWHVVSPA